MAKFSRRHVLAGFASATASTLLSWRATESGALAEDAAPALAGAERRRYANRLLNYFAEIAPQLLRAPEGILRHPSVAPSLPGKTYATNLWDWDTLWTSQGLFRLAALRRDAELQQKLCEHAGGSLLNFLDHASENGQLPIMMTAQDADPFRILMKGGASRNQAKPVFGQLGLLVSTERRGVDWLAPHFDKILRFYDAWTRHNTSSTGLLVWGDDVAIGDDNDPATFGRPYFSSANLLLNCLFYQDLSASAELAHRLGRPADQNRLERRARELAGQIETYCWDPRDHYYYSIDVQCVDRRAELIPTVARGMDMSWKSLPVRVQMFTGFLPLWCGIAPRRRAEELVAINYLADDRFRARWGTRSLSARETMYSLAFSSNPSNWLGPVWIIVNYFVWKALGSYGFAAPAAALADRTIELLGRDLEHSGSLNEYYHPDTGAALSHRGFIDWNLLVLEMLKEDIS